MRKLFLLESRKNRKSIFLYLAALAAVLYQGIGLVGQDFVTLTGNETVDIVGKNLFTTYLLSGAILSYIIVKDFEAGIIKEYFFIGYTRGEIYAVKYLYLLCKGSMIINLVVFGMILWKSLQNQYGLSVSGAEIAFWMRIAAGNIAACFFLFAVSLFCVVVVGNVLSLALYFVGVSFMDVIALLMIQKYNAPKWISVRYLVSSFYDRTMPWVEYATMLALLLGIGGFLLWFGELVFRGKEYK